MQRISKNWITILLGSLVIRFLIAPWFHGFSYDMYIYGNWADTLLSQPLGRFYALAKSPDHLPGDLYIHLLLAKAFTALGGDNLYGDSYRYLLKAFPAMVDVIAAVLIWRFLVSRTSETTARLAAIAFALNPAIIFLSSVWGQWDVVSGAIFLGGLILLWEDKPRPILSGVLFAWALLIKPPLFLLVIFAVAGYLWRSIQIREAVGAIVGKLALMAFAAATTVTLMMLPFRMSWFDGWAEYSLTSRLKMAAELYPYTTLGAANIWMIPIGHPRRIPDTQTFAGITYQTWGLTLFAIVLIVVAFRLLRSVKSPNWFLWAMAATGYAYFLLPTRSHERYLFPALLILVILTAATNSTAVRTLAAAASFTYLFNLIFVYWNLSGPLEVIIMVSLSVLNVLILLRLLFLPGATMSRPSLPDATQIAPELRPVE